jgi:hypothetical protein
MREPGITVATAARPVVFTVFRLGSPGKVSCSYYEPSMVSAFLVETSYSTSVFS